MVNTDIEVELTEALLDLIYTYEGKISVVAVLGVLAVVKQGIIEDA